MFLEFNKFMADASGADGNDLMLISSKGSCSHNFVISHLLVNASRTNKKASDCGFVRIAVRLFFFSFFSLSARVCPGSRNIRAKNGLNNVTVNIFFSNSISGSVELFRRSTSILLVGLSTCRSIVAIVGDRRSPENGL